MNLLSQIVAGMTGFFIADQLINGVVIDPPIMIISAGIILGIINFFVKPILDLITFPLRIITLGLSTFLINIVIVWFVQAIFLEISIDLFLPLLYTTLIVWVLGLVLQLQNKP